MGTLLPNKGNATYSTSGELSPLLNDPHMLTIGIGTRIFLGGTEGFVSWQGTQFNTSKPVNDQGIPLSNARTIAVVGDAKHMSSEYIKAAYFEKYGVSIFIGIGIPIPLLDVDMAKAVSIKNREIETTIADYSKPEKPALGRVNYEQLRSGEIEIDGKKVRTAPMSSLHKARKIALELKSWIESGAFYLTEPVQPMPRFSETKGLGK